MRQPALAVALSAWALGAHAQPRLTCNPEDLDPKSYRLTTQAVAYAVTQERHDWWDSFDLGKYQDDLADLNWAVTRAAERALEIDPRNQLDLHGRSGDLEVYKPVGEERLATRGRGPAGYNDLVRRTIVKFVDPDERIAIPPVKPGAGW